MFGKLTGRDVLLWLIAFFGLVIAVNAYFITISVTTFRGEDEQKPYLQGIEYNRTLARHAEQAKLDWNASMSATRLASGVVRVAIAVADAQGRPQMQLKLFGELRHPSDETRDHTIVLRESGKGRYIADIKGVAPGAWDVIVQNASRTEPFEAVRRMWVP